MKIKAKRKTKALALLLVVALSLLCLSACGGGIDQREAREFIDEFFDTVNEADYDRAERFLHPDYPLDLQAYFARLAKREQLNLDGGFKLDAVTGYSASLYTSEVDGSSYEPTIRATVGDRLVEITVEIVQNQNGYGIYGLEIDV